MRIKRGQHTGNGRLNKLLIGDFLDIRVDAYGRTWFSLSHNLADQGIFGTYHIGPSLRGETITMLAEMPAGGPATL